MATVNIAKLKAELSKYIKLAQSGEEVVVTDHKEPVVKLVVIEHRSKPKLHVVKAIRLISDLKNLKRADPIPELDVVSLLREDRDSR